MSKLLDSLNNLPGNSRTEISVKFVAGEILTHRWLYSTTMANLDSILQLLGQYDLPISALKLHDCFKEHANFVHVGMEHANERTLVKLYLESAKPKSTDDCRFIACKWSTGESGTAVTTVYQEVENTTPGIVRAKIHELLKRHDIKLDSLNPLIETLGSAIFPEDLRLLQVRDQDSSRISYDLNFYDSELLIQHCSKLLTETAKYCHISQSNLVKTLSSIYESTVGHIALGFNAQQHFFITLYYTPE